MDLHGCAQFLHVSARTVHNWESGKHDIPYATYRLRRLLSRMKLFARYSGQDVGLPLLYSGVMPAALMTCPHLVVSAAWNFANSEAEVVQASEPDILKKDLAAALFTALVSS